MTGAQLTLMNGTGRGESRYSTNEIGTLLENMRFTHGEGPCEDCLRSGVPVLAGVLDSWENNQRWPLFTPSADATGARAMFAFPLRSGAIRLRIGVSEAFHILRQYSRSHHLHLSGVAEDVIAGAIDMTALKAATS